MCVCLSLSDCVCELTLTSSLLPLPGYSIGWGDYPEDGLPLQWFSTFYVMAGASFVGAALGFFADAAVHDSNNWYEAQQLEHKYQRELSSHTSFVVKAVFWFSYNYQTIRPVLWWLGFTFVGTLWGCLTQDWPFPTGLYFAVSSMSTGGLQSVDASKTNDDMYFLIGVFSALGVPLMGLAMATVAKGLISTEDISDTMAEIRKDVTIEEVAMLTELGLADDSGEIDKAEFILLCVIRIGAADPMILQLIGEYFDVLDDDGSGSLSMDEITASASVIASHLRSRANLIVADTGIETDRDKDAAPAAATSLSSTIVPSRRCRKSIAIVRPTNTSSEHHDKRKKRRKAALDALFNRQVKDALQSDSESDCNDDDGDGDIENGIEEDSEDNPKGNERHTLQRRDRQSILEMLDVTIFDKKASVGSERFRGSIIGSYRKKQRDKQEQTWVASASKVAPMNSVAEKHEEAQEK